MRRTVLWLAYCFICADGCTCRVGGRLGGTWLFCPGPTNCLFVRCRVVVNSCQYYGVLFIKCINTVGHESKIQSLCKTHVLLRVRDGIYE